MAGWWERQQARRADRRYDRMNPLQGDSPMWGEQNTNRNMLDARANAASRDFAGSRADLAGVLAQYNSLAAGNGPSLADEMFARNSARNISATIAAMGSARGGNLAANQTAAATAGAGLGAQAAQDAAIMRSQEQLNALNAAGGIAGTLAGLDNAREAGILGMGQNALQFQAGQGQAWAMTQAQLRAEAEARRRAEIRAGIQSAAAMGGDVLGGVLSDERMKTDIIELEPGSLAERLAAFAEHDDGGKAAKEAGSWRTTEFRYTDEGRKRGGLAGRLAGVMAQDLEQGERGREAVHETGGVKRIDGARGLSLALAGLADHERRMAELEKRGAA